MSVRKDPARAAESRIDDTLRQLKSLLASETAAVRMYRGASRDITDGVLARRLDAIADRHAAQAFELRRQIARLSGGAAASGTEDAWEKLSDVSGPLAGGSSAWKILRERERIGLKSYRDALDRVDASAREAFLGSLIPAQFRNVCAWNERSPES